MSRVGKRPIPIPDGVRVSAADGEMRVAGPRGELARQIPRGIELEVEGQQVRLLRANERKPTRALHGLSRALLDNMVTGVSKGFVKELEIQGVGYRAEASGDKLTLNLGFSRPVVMTVPKEVEVSVERSVLIRVEGIDREAVGQFAADVRAVRPPEPYKGKGVRYVGERVRRKVGKAGVA